MATVDAVPLATRGVRRRGHDNDGSGNGRARDDLDAFRATPPLPPVSRRQQAAVLASAFLAIALTIGYNQCYGVFQEYYLAAGPAGILTSDPAPSTALLAFVGTLGAGLTWAGSLFVNPWLSRAEEHAVRVRRAGRPASTPARTPASTAGLRAAWTVVPPRGITLAGVALMALGFLLASFATRVWHLLLTQGLLYGVGSSMLYFPLLGPAPEYFTRHRATALGLILAGGGAGSLVLTPAVRALLSALGGRWTLRALAALYLVVGTPVAWAVPPSRFPVGSSNGGGGGGGNEDDAAADGDLSRRRTHVSAALLTTPVFLLSVAAAFFQSAGAQLPLTFVPSYSVALGLSAGTGATLLAVANAVNAAARIATGYAGDRVGRLNMLAVSLACAAVSVGGLWGMSVRAASAAAAADAPYDGGDSPSSSATRLWLAFVVLYSAAAGGYYALFPATIADVFGIRSYVAVNGFLYFVRGCGTMLGSPVGGVLIGRSSSSAPYAGVVVWDGALLAGSTACVLGVRWADAARRGWTWRA